jgi:hypothetical protein
MKAENLCIIIMLPFNILQIVTSIKITHHPKKYYITFLQDKAVSLLPDTFTHTTYFINYYKKLKNKAMGYLPGV